MLSYRNETKITEFFSVISNGLMADGNVISMTKIFELGT